MSSSLTIREARNADADRIAALISDLAREFILADADAQAQERFLGATTPAAIAEFMRGPFRFHVLEIDGELAGVAGMRDNRHLYHLFIARRYQGQGLARRLWRHAAAVCLGSGNPGEFTVNSSINAVAFYERLGFTATASRQARGGISFVPMKLTMTADDPARRSTDGPDAGGDFRADHAHLLIASYRHWTGRDLVENVPQPGALARALYEAPFVVASHGDEPDPVFNYANRAALALFEATWDEFTSMPSRLSAEPVAREERAALLARVTAHGFIDDYGGVRISIRGRRFRIARATVWNVIDARGAHRGQAVVFRDWEYL
jgi:ribosomal protein S18 acetylase RimI-like enzyme